MQGIYRVLFRKAEAHSRGNMGYLMSEKHLLIMWDDKIYQGLGAEPDLSSF